MKGTRGRNAVYGSYIGLAGGVSTVDVRGNRVVAGVGVDGDATRGGIDNVGGVDGESSRESSACIRGMKPGSMDVPPATTIEQAKSFRRSIGT
jgi:hypothetical protein